MEKMNSYYGRAESDYHYAKAGMATGEQLGDYNNVAIMAAESAGKFLKAIIELDFTDDPGVVRLLKTHNLRSLYNKITTKRNLSLSSRDCKWLGDFYFDAQYPGDNFVTVSKNDALECLELLEIIKKDTEAILNDITEDRKKQKEMLKNLKAFD